MITKNYPIYDNGFVTSIDYPKLIQMQSQQPISQFKRKKVSLPKQPVSINKKLDKIRKRIT